MVQRKIESVEDTARIESYLRGVSAAYAEVDGWIRVELQRQYPRLRDDHDDLAQTVHGKLLVELRAERFAGRSTLRRYVQGIAHRTTLLRLRKLYRDRDLATALTDEPRPTSENPYPRVEIRDELRLAHQALMALPETCRELWKLIFVDRLDYEQAGEHLALPVGTVKSRMWHCRRKAAKTLRRLRLLGS